MSNIKSYLRTHYMQNAGPIFINLAKYLYVNLNKQNTRIHWVKALMLLSSSSSTHRLVSRLMTYKNFY